MQYYITRSIIAISVALSLASCTTTQADFQNNPKAVSQAALCRTLLESSDPVFQRQIVRELGRRGIKAWDCPAMVQLENQAIAAVAAVAIVGTAVAVCSNNNCGGGAYTPYRQYPGNCYSYYDRRLMAAAAAPEALCPDRGAGDDHVYPPNSWRIRPLGSSSAARLSIVWR